jgi:spore maturation protein CgeB
MIMKVRSVLTRHGINGHLLERFEEVSAAFQGSQHLVVRDVLNEKFPDLAEKLLELPEDQQLGYEAGVTWQATGWYRQELVKRLQPFNPLIVGDSGWEEALGEGFRLHRELNYYSDLNSFYNISKVSFNATSRQMKECVNQRVFDVPACRRVLLTDWTRQLECLMEPGREVLAYKNGEEIPEQVKQILADKQRYQKTAEAGYRRVQNEHTYCHRLKQLIRIMKSHYS